MMSGDTDVQSNFHNSEGEEWEDIPDANLARDVLKAAASPRSSSVASSTPGTPRTAARRRKVGKVVYVAAQTPPIRRSLKSPTSPKQKQKSGPAIDREQLQGALIQGSAETVRYFGGILSHALRLLRWPFGVLLAIWLLGLIMARLSHTIRGFVRPVCYVPGLSGSALCRPDQVEYDAEGELVPHRADYPKLVEIQSSRFEELLDGSVGGSGLSLEIKKAEMASRDLVTLVRHSELTSKDHLVESLLEFVDDAQKTGKGLQKLTSKINGAVDKIMAINDYALHTIESAQNEPKSLLKVIWPFASTPAEHTQDVVIQAFRDSMDVHAAEMRRLVLELSISETNLERLDMHLITLHELCTRENLTLGAAREDLLSELWTLLGGNRRRLRGMESNLELLRDLGEYRKRAAAHVAAAKQTLQAMSEDMEDLRERVAAPDVLGDRIPVEVHMKSLQSGLERLKEDRIKAREREEYLMNKVLGVASP
ncbi:hypothetical protein BN946_scf184866.g16 [Trametes cinnabarina]|uniref:Uncharacterized protein n=1 Tax=Pycnoporus cinnabarinus TaxID=5643 RepID=A0A060SLA0_PYCCI|nr:hypothetical protein BN946_scf184866.g16 [Trametes cinnabarina]